MEAKKRCTKCGADKPASEYHRSIRGQFGRTSQCKACSASYSSRRRSAAKDGWGLRVPDSKTCPVCKRHWPSRMFQADRGFANGLHSYCLECLPVIRRATLYELSRDRVREMLRQTNCEACGGRFETTPEKHFDHRHADGAVRGVLCEPCNQALGMCRDSPQILRLLAAYAERTVGVDYRKQPYLEQKLRQGDSSTADALTPEGTAELCQTNTTHQPTSPQP